MNSERLLRQPFLVAGLAATLFLACGDDSRMPVDAGHDGSAGVTTSTGGVQGSGGSTSTGGQSGTGGSINTAATSELDASSTAHDAGNGASADLRQGQETTGALDLSSGVETTIAADSPDAATELPDTAANSPDAAPDGRGDVGAWPDSREGGTPVAGLDTNTPDGSLATPDGGSAFEVGKGRDVPSAGACRRYLTQATVAGPSGNGTVTATFSVNSLTYTGNFHIGQAQITQSRVYASLADYVLEPAIMGRILWRKESAHGSVEQTTTTSFDGDGRLATKALVDLQGGDGTTTYSQWDSQGRPTKGSLTANPAELDCANMGVTVVYDDSTRRRTETITPSQGSGTGCPKNTTYKTSEVYDTDGNVIESIHPDETAATTITVMTTEQVCLN